MVLAMVFGVAVVVFLNQTSDTATHLATHPIETNEANIAADLSITQTNNLMQVLPGTQVVYTITVSNLSTETITNAAFIDAFSPNYAPQRVVWSGVNAIATDGVLTTGQPIRYAMSFGPSGYLSVVLTGTVRADATGLLTNTAKITAPADVTDPNLSNNTTSDTDPIIVPANPMADVQISVSDGVTQVKPSQTLTYTVLITNAGPQAATGVRITDVLPSGYQAISASVSYHAATQRDLGLFAGVLTVTCDMLPGGTVTMVIGGLVKPAVTMDLTNTAIVTLPATTMDPDGANNSATDVDTLMIRPRTYVPLIQK